MKKTNAIRELETHKIEHIVREYEVDEDHLDALSVAVKTNEDITRVFKTLVLLKLAKLSGSKKVEMLPMKDLFSMTGYLRGGCSPIAIKKRHTAFIHNSATDNETILISGGLRGLQIEISPQKLIDYLNLIVGDIIE